MLSTYCSSCFHNNFKTSNTITVPLSNYKFFVSMVYLSHIYNGSFARLFQEQSGYKHIWKQALICGILLPAILKNSNENILLLAECFRNYIVKKRLWHMCFPMNFWKFLRTPFLTEHLRWLLLEL